MPNPLVIVPTYNEIENIELLIKAVLALPVSFDVLIVDDNSPDGTATTVKELTTTYSNRLFLEKRAGKLGLGTAYIHGFTWALKRDYQHIFEMDADFSHNPNDLVKLYKTAIDEQVDMVIGSRYIKGVNVVNWPMSRVLLSYGASKYVQFVTGMPICDTTAGFVCYSRKLLEQINLNNIKFVGYAFQIEMKFKAYQKKCTYKEIPVIFTDRTRGNSKMSKGIISEAIFGVIQMKLNSIFNKK